MTADEILAMEDVELVFRMLPDGWEEKAVELKALGRRRSIPNAQVLFRLLMMHIGPGMSLRETATVAQHSNMAQISAEGLHYRMRQAGDWLGWMTERLAQDWVPPAARPVLPGRWRIRFVDGSHVREPGPTGSVWRVHYAITLPQLRCDEVHLTSTQRGETFKRFSIQEGDLMIGDRAYSTAAGVAHVTQHNAHVLVRINHASTALESADGTPLDLLSALKGLKTEGQTLDLPVTMVSSEHRIAGRLCAVRKSDQARESEEKRVRRRASKKQYNVSEDTIALAAYTFIFCTIPKEELSCEEVLEVYRGRWQVELAFKRLKSILGTGHLPKHNDDTARTWLQGKLLLACLLENLLDQAETFFPWGYPIRSVGQAQPEPLA